MHSEDAPIANVVAKDGVFALSNLDDANIGTVHGRSATPELAALAFLPKLLNSEPAVVTASVLAWKL